MENCRIEIDGISLRKVGTNVAALKAAARFFAAKSSSRIGIPFRCVAIILQDDAFSAQTHAAINGVEGPTDVTTQRYDAIPPEPDGIYGELYVNLDRAVAVGSSRRGRSALRELLLYVAHGMDHLSGADDMTAAGYNTMRRRELKWIREFLNA